MVRCKNARARAHTYTHTLVYTHTQYSCAHTCTCDTHTHAYITPTYAHAAHLHTPTARFQVRRRTTIMNQKPPGDGSLATEAPTGMAAVDDNGNQVTSNIPAHNTTQTCMQRTHAFRSRRGFRSNSRNCWLIPHYS